MNKKILIQIYNFFYNILKSYFIKKYKSELLENMTCSQEIHCQEKVKEIEIHRLAVPLQIQFKHQNDIISKFGCYFLCVLFIALVVKEIQNNIEKCFDCFEVDLLFRALANKGCLRGDNAYVNSPNAIFANLGIDEDIYFDEKHFPASYVPKESDILIAKYKSLESNMYHFVIIDNDLTSVIWDSLGNSKTVSNGNLESLRVFKILDQSIIKGVKERFKFYNQKLKDKEL